MRTFEEIGKEVHFLHEQYPNDIVYRTLAELTKALGRLEYNVAAQLTAKGAHLGIEAEIMQRTIAGYVELLRRDIPDQSPPPPLHYSLESTSARSEFLPE
jgi:hypothetical protein